MIEPVKLYRCVSCGRWSHAKRKPRAHERCVVDDGIVAEPDPDTVVRAEPGVYSHLLGDESPGVWWIRCGPFETWTATRDEEDTA